MKKFLIKVKDGIAIGIGIVFIAGISGLAYASYSWVTQSDVNPGDTLSASNWNDMVNNHNYLKQEVEGIDFNPFLEKAGDTMAGELNMGNNKITALGTPTATTDVTNKAYVDSVSASGGEGNYQISCSNHYTNGAAYCIRINTITGTTECKYRAGGGYYYLRRNGNNWVVCDATPW